MLSLFSGTRAHYSQEITEKVASFLHQLFSLDKSCDNPLQLVQVLASDLDRLLFARDLSRQALVYARYHLKAQAKEASGMVSVVSVGRFSAGFGGYNRHCMWACRPAGSVNRCRLYLPAHALWGARTAEIARANSANSATPPNYERIGDCLRDQVRLTYLFPADETGGKWSAWLPRYTTEDGLVWEREDDPDPPLSYSQFRMRLLATRPATAIDPASETAFEGSLRETEVINTRWRDRDGKPLDSAGWLLVDQSAT